VSGGADQEGHAIKGVRGSHSPHVNIGGGGSLHLVLLVRDKIHISRIIKRAEPAIASLIPFAYLSEILLNKTPESWM
jgi:hypothetical protein